MFRAAQESRLLDQQIHGAGSGEIKMLRFASLLIFVMTAFMVAATAQTPAPESPAAVPTSPGGAANVPKTVIVLVPKGVLAVARTTRAYNSYAAHTGEKMS